MPKSSCPSSIGLLRRTGPALCGFLLLCAPLACRDDTPEPTSGWQQGVPLGASPRASSTSKSEPSSTEEALPTAIPIPSATPSIALSVSVDGNAVTRQVERGSLSIAGYYKVQLSSANLPRASAVPTFLWTANSQSRVWPYEARVELPQDGRSYLIAWVDLDANGRLSTGDRVSPPLDPLGEVVEDNLAIRVDRIFVDPTSAAANTNSPGGGRDPEGPRTGPGPGDPEQRGPLQGCFGGAESELLYMAPGPRETHKLQVNASEAVASAGRGRLLIYGFPDEQLNDLGMPSEGSQPSLVWIRSKKTRKWPILIEVPIPPDKSLLLLPVFDLDDDKRLSQGDFIGQALSVDALRQVDGGFELKIDRELPSQGDPSTRQETGSRGPPSAAAAPSTPSLRLLVDNTEAEEVPQASRLLLYGYPPDAFNEFGTPNEHSPPLYLWTSPELVMRLPDSVRTPDPLTGRSDLTEEALSLVLVLDLDGNGALSQGDSLSPPVPYLKAQETPFRVSLVLGTPSGPDSRGALPVQRSDQVVPFPTTRAEPSAGCNMVSNTGRS